MGLGIAENVLEAYQYLAENYSKGDEIFLFGFSRGAYTVRSVAALIGWLGLMTKKGLGHLKPIYKGYQDAKTREDFALFLTEYSAKHQLKYTNWRVVPEQTPIKVVGMSTPEILSHTA